MDFTLMTFYLENCPKAHISKKMAKLKESLKCANKTYRFVTTYHSYKFQLLELIPSKRSFWAIYRQNSKQV